MSLRTITTAVGLFLAGIAPAAMAFHPRPASGHFRSGNSGLHQTRSIRSFDHDGTRIMPRDPARRENGRNRLNPEPHVYGPTDDRGSGQYDRRDERGNGQYDRDDDDERGDGRYDRGDDDERGDAQYNREGDDDERGYGEYNRRDRRDYGRYDRRSEDHHGRRWNAKHRRERDDDENDD